MWLFPGMGRQCHIGEREGQLPVCEATKGKPEPLIPEAGKLPLPILRCKPASILPVSLWLVRVFSLMFSVIPRKEKLNTKLLAYILFAQCQFQMQLESI